MTSNTAQHRRRGRPRDAVLSVDRIVEAAIHIVTLKGYDHLTMNSLAKQLGVSASSVYNHASSKQQVLTHVQDRINQRIDCSAFSSEPWDVALERWAWSYRNCYAKHTAIIPIMAVLPVADSPYTLRMYETVANALAEAGWDRRWIMNIIIGVESLVFGAAFDANAPADIFDPGSLEHLAPTLAYLNQHRPHDAETAAEKAFHATLDAMLAGFRLHLLAEAR